MHFENRIVVEPEHELNDPVRGAWIWITKTAQLPDHAGNALRVEKAIVVHCARGCEEMSS